MPLSQQLEFTESSERPKNPHQDSPKYPEPYVVSDPLRKAVNLAIYLRRPLLLEGDAGCGKTRLASAVAYELGLPLYRWNVRSTTKAQDGLYEYDALLRLHDVQTQKMLLEHSGAELDGDADESQAKLDRDPANPEDYLEYGALGKAFLLTDRPAIVLIDEIDKADLDFPNDLLAVLDDPWEFFIKETGKTIGATYLGRERQNLSQNGQVDCRPIIIITSNKEKGNLPTPFLRRCLYHYLTFPNDSKQLEAIVEKHYQIAEESSPPKALVQNAVKRFLTVWQTEGLFKKPGTSEFLDWLKALHTFTPQPYDSVTLEEQQYPPYPELLFKLQQDWKKYARA